MNGYVGRQAVERKKKAWRKIFRCDGWSKVTTDKLVEERWTHAWRQVTEMKQGEHTWEVRGTHCHEKNYLSVKKVSCVWNEILNWEEKRRGNMKRRLRQNAEPSHSIAQLLLTTNNSGFLRHRLGKQKASQENSLIHRAMVICWVFVHALATSKRHIAVVMEEEAKLLTH